MLTTTPRAHFHFLKSSLNYTELKAFCQYTILVKERAKINSLILKKESMNIGIILLIVIAGIGLYAVTIYNGLQSLKTQIVASIQEIGNQLKRQSSLIPNLQEAVKAYMGQEKGIFQML